MNFEVIKITLICDEDALKKRILGDVKLKLRDEECVSRSVERLDLYKEMSTKKIDTSNISVLETVDKIMKII